MPDMRPLQTDSGGGASRIFLGFAPVTLRSASEYIKPFGLISKAKRYRPAYKTKDVGAMWSIAAWAEGARQGGGTSAPPEIGLPSRGHKALHLEEV